MDREASPAVADIRAVNRLNLEDRGVARVARCCVIVRDQKVVRRVDTLGENVVLHGAEAVRERESRARCADRGERLDVRKTIDAEVCASGGRAGNVREVGRFLRCAGDAGVVALGDGFGGSSENKTQRGKGVCVSEISPRARYSAAID